MDGMLAARLVILVTMTGSGALLLWMARATASGRLKRNPLAGIRIPSTMTSDEAWLAAHVRAKRPTVAAGLVAVATGGTALLPLSEAALAVVVIIGALVMTAFTLYGARVGGQAARAVTEGR